MYYFLVRKCCVTFIVIHYWLCVLRCPCGR